MSKYLNEMVYVRNTHKSGLMRFPSAPKGDEGRGEKQLLHIMKSRMSNDETSPKMSGSASLAGAPDML